MQEEENAPEVDVANNLKHWNEKEQALKLLQEEIWLHPEVVENTENFLGALKLIVQSLLESSISVYLQAVETVNEYFKACLQYNYEYLFINSEDILTPMICKSGDSNTRVR